MRARLSCAVPPVRCSITPPAGSATTVVPRMVRIMPAPGRRRTALPHCPCRPRPKFPPIAPPGSPSLPRCRPREGHQRRHSTRNWSSAGRRLHVHHQPLTSRPLQRMPTGHVPGPGATPTFPGQRSQRPCPASTPGTGTSASGTCPSQLPSRCLSLSVSSSLPTVFSRAIARRRPLQVTRLPRQPSLTLLLAKPPRRKPPPRRRPR